MKFRFWGVRGSIPSPGPRTVRYGGNTTCIEVRRSDGTLIVLDAGTGLYALAQDLMARRALDGADVRNDTAVMTPSVTSLGCPISWNGKSLFFTDDHEPFANQHPGDEGRRQEADAAMAGVDALIVDCSYTVEEYPARQGWGHGTFD